MSLLHMIFKTSSISVVVPYILLRIVSAVKVTFRFNTIFKEIAFLHYTKLEVVINLPQLQ